MEINWKRIGEEATDLLRSLIRCNTTNPPGNEILTATFIKTILEQEGIPVEIYESAPKRGNLVARIAGDGTQKPIMLLSHMDVVAANSDQWSFDPFAGIIDGGYIWGRGALDMKGMLAMELMTLILYKRSGQVPGRELILVAVADEEVGGLFGIDWLLSQKIPGFDDVEFVINEGGTGFSQNGRAVYTCQNAEKGLLWLKLSISGTPGHASMPSKDNAIMQMNKIIGRIGRHREPMKLCETSRSFLSQMAIQHGVKLPNIPESIDYTLKLFATRHFNRERSVQGMLFNTISPTILQAGIKTNVLPEQCELTLDCRLVPGETPEHFLEQLRNVINDSGVSLEILQSAPPTESPVDTELFRVMRQVVQQSGPNSDVLPYLSTLATDSRYFRQKGITSYGFIPILISEAELQRMHGINERISLTNLEAGTKILYEVIQEISRR
jgi:acetylornithine deacetylase/succinyl-diaminopimelate desuccinylase-like protein